MKDKLSTVGRAFIKMSFILGVLILIGCGRAAIIADVEVAPGAVEVEVAVGGFGAEVTVDGLDGEVAVEVPGVKVITGASGVQVITGASGVIRGSGNVVTEERPVRDFNRLSLIGTGDVFITQGEKESLTVEADDNLMPYIKSEVKDGTLTLGFTDEVRNGNVKPSRPIKFNLTVKQILNLELSGAMDIADLLRQRIGGEK